MVIGVTGHRNITPHSLERHREELIRLLNHCQEQSPAGGVRVLSPLAEGADQFIAELAHSQGIAFECPLPLPLELYEEDFAPGPARDKFRKLMEEAIAVYPIPACEGVPRDAIRQYGPARDEMYAAVGRFVVDRSDLLIALWDGEVNGKPGGTADTLCYALKHIRTPPLKVLTFMVERQTAVP